MFIDRQMARDRDEISDKTLAVLNLYHRFWLHIFVWKLLKQRHQRVLEHLWMIKNHQIFENALENDLFGHTRESLWNIEAI
jgi:hypothetical protein